ncbi:MAG: MBL fold metallo-hydrolase, partial [Clostridiales bacterium]|nr:MBL fold metallo-hydrolase [Clostridiales bacterium]
NCIFLGTEKARILVDAGMSGNSIAKSLCDIGERPDSINAIFITHEHSDHIKGAGILSRKYNIPIYANEITWMAMDAEIGPVSPENRKLLSYTGLEINDIVINSFSISHDAVSPVGYVFTSKNRKVSVATDTGMVTEQLRHNLAGSDLVLIEANHDTEMLKAGKYPWRLKQRILGEKGHLSNEAAGELAVELAQGGTRRFFLGHLSHENNFPELAFETVKGQLAEKQIIAGKDIYLRVAPRDRNSGMVVL